MIEVNSDEDSDEDAIDALPIKFRNRSNQANKITFTNINELYDKLYSETEHKFLHGKTMKILIIKNSFDTSPEFITKNELSKFPDDWNVTIRK